MGLTFQHLEMQGGLDFRPWITGIASVQKTCGIDPKVLGSIALRGVVWLSEKPGFLGVCTAGGRAQLYPQNPVLLMYFYCPTGVAHLSGVLRFVGWGGCHSTWWHAQVGGLYLVNLIPFRLQGREGFGFLASVNLGLDARTILALSAVGWRLVRHHDVPQV
jgi:hypothetical protein